MGRTNGRSVPAELSTGILRRDHGATNGARAENVVRLRARSPHASAGVADVKRDPLARWGRFDVVFCYGLLYHLENPMAALRNMGSACDDFLLLETIVADTDLPILHFVEEPKAEDQAMRGLAARPSRGFVLLALRHVGFSRVYRPRTPPDHPEFRFERRGDGAFQRDGLYLRSVFIASRRPLRNDALEET